MTTNFTKKIAIATLIMVGFYTGAKAQSDDQSAYDDQYGQQQQYAQQQQPPYVAPAPQYTAPAPQYAQQGFDYYPDANVYYDNSCNHYIYNNGYGWVTVNVLPAGIFLTGNPFRVYHSGPQVWLDNAIHLRSFGRGGNFYGRGGYRPVVVHNNGGYRGGRDLGYNRGGGDFNHGGFNRGESEGNHGGSFGGGRHASYRR